jgi:hypothetical protein
MQVRVAVWVLLAIAWAAVSGADPSDDVSEQQRRELERIATLGYVTGSERAPTASGVTVRDSAACEGYTLCVSRGYPGAFLVDLDGDVVHSWEEEGPREWTRAWAYPNGDVLSISAYPARLAKFDRDSHPLWSYGDDRMRAHHDFQVQPDGTIYVLMRHACFLPWLRETPLQEDMVCILAPDGPVVRVVDCISVAEAFRDSEYSDMLTADWFMEEGDPFHCNSVEVLDGRVPDPAFRAGNVLLSIRNMDCLAVLDPERRAIVWVSRGPWQRQHEARATPSGYVMLFDNRTFDGRSRVVKYDVRSNEIVWSYSEDGFYSLGTGAEQLLPNGDILITESQKGRIFEITLEGRIVWEYLNPMRINGNQTIVGFTRARRFPKTYFAGDFRQMLADEGSPH